MPQAFNARGRARSLTANDDRRTLPRMKRTVQVMAWVFFALDAAALLFFLAWALTAGAREGESAYALAFLLFVAAFVAVGGGALVFSTRRGSALGLGCAALVLGLPPLIVLGIWISNLL